jgi:hypothetical protein
MKIRDLEKCQADGTTVAFSSWGGADSDYAQEVRVLNARSSRTVHTATGRSSWTSRGHEAHGVLIEHVREDHEVRRDTVALSKLIGTWEEYTEQRRKRQEYKAAQEQRKTRSEDEAKAQANDLKVRIQMAGKKVGYDDIAVVGVGGYSGRGSYRAPYAYGIRVSPGILDWLLNKEV